MGQAMQVHYNYQALRERYMRNNRKTPDFTDERYCKVEGLPEEWANTPKLVNHFIEQQSDPIRGRKEIMKLLAENGISLEGI